MRNETERREICVWFYCLTYSFFSFLFYSLLCFASSFAAVDTTTFVPQASASFCYPPASNTPTR